MNSSTPRSPGRSLVLAAAVALSAACAGDSPTEARPLAAKTAAASRAVELGTCTNLALGDTAKLAFHTYADGVQIYRWTGGAWEFVAPRATLYADAGLHGIVGTHYAGPKWESNAGGTVKGAVSRRCTPDASAIPWLLLDATPDAGPGIFHRVRYIQRVNTVGGNAPAAPGSTVGELREVPYTAEYFFYREH